MVRGLYFPGRTENLRQWTWRKEDRPSLVTKKRFCMPVDSPAVVADTPKVSPAESVVRPSFEIARSRAELEPHLAAWENLARHALEPNVYYEPWMVQPALDAFGWDPGLVFVFIYGPDPAKHGKGKVLLGLFPVKARRGLKGIPAKVLGLWQHKYCVLGMPLLRVGAATEAYRSFLEWARTGPYASGLLEMPLLPAQGSGYQVIVEEAFHSGRLSYVHETYNRALLIPQPKTYLDRTNFSRSRKETQRRERRLAEQGRLEYRILDKAEELSDWLDAFLELEARGWKGEEGTAFACVAEDRAYFRTVAGEAFRRGQLQMLAMYLNDRAIAMKCNLLAPPGSFAFKIAYDQSLAKYSPGVQLEIFNIEQLHKLPELAWMDSCAIAQHPMINRLWQDRRTIQEMVISTGRAPGDFVVSVVPGLRWLKRKFSFRRAGTKLEAEEEST